MIGMSIGNPFVSCSTENFGPGPIFSENYFFEKNGPVLKFFLGFFCYNLHVAAYTVILRLHQLATLTVSFHVVIMPGPLHTAEWTGEM